LWHGCRNSAGWPHALSTVGPLMELTLRIRSSSGKRETLLVRVSALRSAFTLVVVLPIDVDEFWRNWIWKKECSLSRGGAKEWSSEGEVQTPCYTYRLICEEAGCSKDWCRGLQKVQVRMSSAQFVKLTYSRPFEGLREITPERFWNGSID
jgi:hypothetical protein